MLRRNPSETPNLVAFAVCSITARPSMFDCILIANRGEIACRVIRTCRRLGIRTVAVYSRGRCRCPARAPGRRGLPDRRTASGRIATCAATRSSRSRKQAGAQAIHPGYGFLIRERRLRRRLRRGRHRLHRAAPGKHRCARWARKAGAKELMEKPRRAVVPGYTGEDQDRRSTLAARGANASATR